MNVIVRIQFESPDAEDRSAMRSIAKNLTNRPKSVRVFTDEKDPLWLVAEFEMPAEAQYVAVPNIYSEIRF